MRLPVDLDLEPLLQDVRDRLILSLADDERHGGRRAAAQRVLDLPERIPAGDPGQDDEQQRQEPRPERTAPRRGSAYR